MYLSNLEKESLFLTGFNDVPPWVVKQALEQALGRGSYIPGEEALRMRLAAQVEDDAFAEGLQQGLVEGSEEPPADRWRSPLEIVTEGAEEAEQEEQEAPGEEEAPLAVAQRIEDRDFSSFTKTQLVNFAQDYFGVELKRTVPRDELIATVQGLVDEVNEKAV